MNWIKCEDQLPPEEQKINTLWFDVWVEGFRLIDVKYKNGDFIEQIQDHDGDYSHDEKIYNVTHWAAITKPEDV